MSIRKQFSAVIIGAGKIGVLFENEKNRPKPASYAGAFSAHPKIVLKAIADPNKSALEKAKRLFPEVNYYRNARDCLEKEKPDIIAIASSTSAHLNNLKLCLKSSCKAIICEKPLSESLVSAKAMRSLMKKDKRIFLINYQRRFFPPFHKAKKAIQGGKLGKIQQISGYYVNGLFTNATHLIDAVRFLLNSEPDSLIAQKNSENKDHPKLDLNVDAIIHFKNGAKLLLQSFSKKHYSLHEIKIFGDKGALFIEDFGFSFKWLKAQKSKHFSRIKTLEDKSSSGKKEVQSMIKGVVSELVRRLEGRSKNSSSLENGYKNMLVLDAIERSARENSKKIRLKI